MSETAAEKTARQIRELEQAARDAYNAVPAYARDKSRPKPIGSTELRFLAP